MHPHLPPPPQMTRVDWMLTGVSAVVEAAVVILAIRRWMRV